MKRIDKKHLFRGLIAILLIILINFPVFTFLKINIANLFYIPGLSLNIFLENSNVAYASTPFCSTGQVACLGNECPACSNSSYTLMCINGFPDCCKNVGNSLDCQPGFLTCSTNNCSNSTSSSSGGGSTTSSTSSSGTTTSSSGGSSSGNSTTSSSSSSGACVPGCDGNNNVTCCGDFTYICPNAGETAMCIVGIPACAGGNMITFNSGMCGCALTCTTNADLMCCSNDYEVTCPSGYTQICVMGSTNIPSCILGNNPNTIVPATCELSTSSSSSGGSSSGSTTSSSGGSSSGSTTSSSGCALTGQDCTNQGCTAFDPGLCMCLGCPSSSSGSSSGSTTTGGAPSPCSFAVCGNNCCVNGCCVTNTFICADAAACVTSSSSSGVILVIDGSSGGLNSTSSSSSGLLSSSGGTGTTSSGSSGTVASNIMALCGLNGPVCPDNYFFTCPTSGSPVCQLGLPVCNVNGVFVPGVCEESTPFCENNIPLCTFGLTFECPEDGIPVCNTLGIPLCNANGEFVLGLCTAALSLSIDKEATFLSVIQTPLLPSFIDKPLIIDDFIGKIGFAYVGSNPSFEVQLLTPDIGFDIVSATIQDSQGTLFGNVLFMVTAISGFNDRFILTLQLPEELNTGQSIFNLELNNNQVLQGIIEILETPKEVEQIIKDGTRRTKIIKDKPEIKRIKAKRQNNKVFIKLKGKNFAHRNIFFLKDGVKVFHENGGLPDPTSLVTVYPSNLGIKVLKRSVRLKGKLMRIKLRLPKGINKKIDAVLVLATPQGIISMPFVILPNKDKVRFNRELVLNDD